MISYKDKERIIILTEDITESNSGDLISHIIEINELDDKKEKKRNNYKRKPIKLYVNSYGGDIYVMWSIIDTIQNSKTPVHTYCTGYAMSAAFKIFLAGHKRFASKHATFMYHQLSSWNFGKLKEIKEWTKELSRLQEMIEIYVSSTTKLSKDDLEKIRKNKEDYYIPANKALKLGIIDKMLEN